MNDNQRHQTGVGPTVRGKSFAPLTIVSSKLFGGAESRFTVPRSLGGNASPPAPRQWTLDHPRAPRSTGLADVVRRRRFELELFLERFAKSAGNILHSLFVDQPERQDLECQEVDHPARESSSLSRSEASTCSDG